MSIVGELMHSHPRCDCGGRLYAIKVRQEYGAYLPYWFCGMCEHRVGAADDLRWPSVAERDLMEIDPCGLDVSLYDIRTFLA